ncbi:hypothetical protein BFP76_10950 [Amylibacter kogurei]|uniref:CPBP family intramembrane metalloprotease n=1 Tax=Paramylibacter kogurei TaxID=1889778 RepID=A0A2G5KDT1_9RHOB|nr:hypothetical protein [Amylibacter kogurei]PIB26764.1 hypothetical protein BFP76_10950 [Amylibacter kogurei]
MQFIRKNEVWVFLLLIPILNWAFVEWVAAGIESAGGEENYPMSIYRHGRFFLLGGALFVLVMITRGFGGITELLRPMLNWRVNILWYVFALGWAAFVCCLVLLGKGILNGNGLSEITISFDVMNSAWMWFTLLIWAFIGEIVWVSYAVRQLQKDMSIFNAAMIVGIFWSLWWFPIVFIGISIIPGLPLGALTLNMMAAAGMCAFVYAHTKSGICVWLLQFMLNSMLLVFPVSPTSGGIPTYWAYAIVYFILMLVLFYLFGPTKRKPVNQTVPHSIGNRMHQLQDS